MILEVIKSFEWIFFVFCLFLIQQREQLTTLKKDLHDEISFHEEQIQRHQEAIERHKKRVDNLDSKEDAPKVWN